MYEEPKIEIEDVELTDVISDYESDFDGEYA